MACNCTNAKDDEIDVLTAEVDELRESLRAITSALGLHKDAMEERVIEAAREAAKRGKAADPPDPPDPSNVRYTVSGRYPHFRGIPVELDEALRASILQHMAAYGVVEVTVDNSAALAKGGE